jgi:hypothetical protein
MKTISLKTAKDIAVDWHGGQWSALYSFASSGIVKGGDINKYLTEIEDNINNADIKKPELERLEKLKNFLIIKSRQAIN